MVFWFCMIAIPLQNGMQEKVIITCFHQLRLNGTTWKVFLKWRHCKELYFCCIDTDWGMGLFSKTHPIGNALSGNSNPFFEFDSLKKNRKEWLNLVSFEQLVKSLKKEKAH